MSDTQPIYNSRITRVYLEYIKKHYPDLDVRPLLESADMKAYEVADPNHWFSQDQADRFNKSLVQATQDPEIARKAGRYATSSEGLGAAKQYLLGLLNLSALYMLVGKVYVLFSRGVSIKAKKLGPNRVEIISRPQSGVNEKPYQCENRIGMFESVARFFIQKFALVEHPECFHKGHDHCRYIITWGKSRTSVLKQSRNIFVVAGIATFLVLFFLVPFKPWGISVLSFALVAMTVSYIAEYFSRKEMAAIVEMKGYEARDLIEEMAPPTA